MSTYLLTWMELEAHVSAMSLVLWDPQRKGVADDGRALYMTPNLFRQMREGPWPGKDLDRSAAATRERRAAMRMVIERFINGAYLKNELEIAELGSRLLKPQHRGFWEFKSGKPDIETRMFGFFARRGAFVGLSLRARDEVNFATEYVKCKSEWDGLTGGRPVLDTPYPVVTQNDLRMYLTREDDD